MNSLKSIGGTLIGITIFIGVFIAIVLIFTYGAKMAFAIAPFISGLAGILLIINLILLFFAIIPKARFIVGNIIMYSALVYGLSAWIYGLAVTLALWGWLGVIVGVLLGGIGVVPIGMLASVIGGHWDLFWPLFINVIIYFGALIVGGLLADSAEGQSEDRHDVIDIEEQPKHDTKRTWGDLE